MIPIEPKKIGKLTSIYNEPMKWSEVFTILGFALAYWIFAGLFIYAIISFT